MTKVSRSLRSRWVCPCPWVTLAVSIIFNTILIQAKSGLVITSTMSDRLNRSCHCRSVRDEFVELFRLQPFIFDGGNDDVLLQLPDQSIFNSYIQNQHLCPLLTETSCLRRSFDCSRHNHVPCWCVAVPLPVPWDPSHVVVMVITSVQPEAPRPKKSIYRYYTRILQSGIGESFTIQQPSQIAWDWRTQSFLDDLGLAKGFMEWVTQFITIITKLLTSYRRHYASQHRKRDIIFFPLDVGIWW